MLPDIRVDRWRDGCNRRVFVALDGDRVVGYSAGIDNEFHPDSRTLVLETLPEYRDTASAPLVEAQLEVSLLPLRMKIYGDQAADQQLAAHFGGVAVQLAPPFGRIVTEELQGWAQSHQPKVGTIEPIKDSDLETLLELYVDDYIDQHASWSPAAERSVLLREFAPDFAPDASESFDRERSVLLRRDGDIVAAGLLWPHDDEFDGREVSFVARPYWGPDARADKEAVLGAVIASAATGDSLLIDSHLSMRDEFAMIADLPGAQHDGHWMAIVAIPVPGMDHDIRPLPRALVPEAAECVLPLIG